MSPDPRLRKPGDCTPGTGRSGRVTGLFPFFSPETVTLMDGYPALLRRVMQLRPGLERELPHRIRDLSLSLTAEREGGPKPGYLSDPRSLAAYAWYFLPWNLYRLTRLLPALDLDLPDDALICDLGAGPLTLVQALWLARPDLRRKRLRFVCVDRSRKALDLGLALFAGLAGFDPTAKDAPWRIRAVRGEYWQGLADGAHLITMVNVANELAGGGGREPLNERMERLGVQLGEALAPGGRALVVEPGTRLGWRCLLGLRDIFLEMEFGLLAPCPHARTCPLFEGRTRAWCHFTMAPQGAPAWLAALSERAGLGKQRLSLSFLFVRKDAMSYAPDAVRVVSGAFSLTDSPGAAVYGCTAKGLAVLVAPDNHPPRSGDLLHMEVPADAPRDAKSGAPRLMLPAQRKPHSVRTDDAVAATPGERNRPSHAKRPGGFGAGASRPPRPGEEDARKHARPRPSGQSRQASRPGVTPTGRGPGRSRSGAKTPAPGKADGRS